MHSYQEACKSCGAPIFWATNAKTGKRLPVDWEPVPDGHLMIQEEVGEEIIVHWLTRVDLKAPAHDLPEYRYQSHFKTCPQALAWSRTKQKGSLS